MNEAKILKFPGAARPVVPVESSAVPAVKRSLVKRVAVAFFRTLSLAIVIFNKPLRVLLSLGCSWYFIRWLVLDGGASVLSGWVSLACFFGIAAVHFTVLTVARNRR